MLRSASAFVLLACIAGATIAHAEAMRVPGTRVSLSPPPGFLEAEQFAGFQLASRGASIVVTESSGPVAEFRKGMTKGGLASRGMSLLQSQTVNIGGQEALLIQASQSTRGSGFLKWILVGGDARGSVMIVGSFPKSESDLSEPVRESILTSTWSEKQRGDLFEGLAFRADPSSKLKLADRMGNMLVFSETGAIEPSDSTQAILVVGGSLSETVIENLEKFAKERAAKTEGIGPLRNLIGRSMTVDGLAGYELIGIATYNKNGRDVRLYQLVLADGTTYYLAQGLLGADRDPRFVSEFRRVTATFRRTGR